MQLLAPDTNIADIKWLWTLLANIIPLVLLQIPTLADLVWLCIMATVATFCYASIIAASSIHQCTFVSTNVWSTQNASAPPTGVVDPAMTSIAGRPAAMPSSKVFMVCTGLGVIANIFNCTEVVVEWASNIKAAPHSTNKPRANQANTWSVTAAVIFTMVVGITGYGATAGACEDAIDCIQLPVPLLVWLQHPDDNYLFTMHCMQVIVNALVLFSASVAYALFAAPVLALFDGSFPQRSARMAQRPTLPRVCVRSMYAAIVAVVALLLPFFEAMVSLMGAMTFYPMAILVPSLVWAAHTRPSRPMQLALVVFNLVGLAVSGAALAGSVAEIALAV